MTVLVPLLTIGLPHLSQVVAYVRGRFHVTVSVPLWFVSLKCCSAFKSNVRFKFVNPSKILILLSMLGYPCEGILGRPVAAGKSFLFLHQKKIPTTNRACEWSSVPNILEPYFKKIMLQIRNNFDVKINQLAFQNTGTLERK